MAQDSRSPSAHHRLTASRTGSASAAVLANTGVILGDVTLRTSLPVRSSYRETVSRIAPAELADREGELRELTSFALEPQTDGRYAWWRASKWSGKSALLAWFVLYPPPGVRIVSFFVTSRLADQNDRMAFLDNVVEQLAELLEEPLPVTTPATRESHFRDMLRSAAARCRERGERLVLVVDGLDEDRGVTGPNDHSIAGLLPGSLPTGMCVVVAGRENPPLPWDVPADHPLRGHDVIRRLSPSPWAAAERERMAAELDHILAGSVTGQDVLGLVVAAGGGLSAEDLAELTDTTDYQVDRLLRTVSGRTFDSRPARWRPESGRDVYLLGHEELQQTAAAMLGAKRLVAYRERLHDWFATYHAQGWPTDTPEYLLRGYFRMLRSTGDRARMVECGTDHARHERMWELSGTDAAGLDEVVAAQDAVIGHPDVDLIALARLAVHRDLLQGRNQSIPGHLPTLWAHLGEPDRGEALARLIAEPGQRVIVMAHLAIALMDCGDPDRAHRLLHGARADMNRITDHSLPRVVEEMVAAVAATGDFDGAEDLARTGLTGDPRTRALCRVASALAAAGRFRRAVALVRGCTGWYAHAALKDLALSVAANGRLDRAEAMVRTLPRLADEDALSDLVPLVHDAVGVERAEALARSLTDPARRAFALCNLASALAEHGEQQAAVRLVHDARSLVGSITHGDIAQLVLSNVASVIARLGDVDRAETIAGDIRFGFAVSVAYAGLSTATARTGQWDRAERLAGRCLDTVRRAAALSRIARTAMEGGVDDVTRRLVDAVLTAAGEERSGDRRTDIVDELVTVMGDEPGHNVVEDAARRIAAGRLQAEVYCVLARAVAAHDIDRAKRLAREAGIGARADRDADTQANDLEHLALAFSTSEDNARAVAVASCISDVSRRSEALRRLVYQLARTGDVPGAEHLAATIPDPGQRVVALCAVVSVGGRHVDPAVARRLLDAAGAGARDVVGPVDQVELLCTVSRAASGTGDVVLARALAGQAEILAGQVDDPRKQSSALDRVARALLACGDQDAARSAAERIGDGSARGAALHSIARAAPDGGDAVLRAQKLVDEMIQPFSRGEALAHLASVQARAGDLENAEATALGIEHDLWQHTALRELARTAAAHGDVERADQLARAVRDTSAQTRLRIDLARLAHERQDHDRARRLLFEIEAQGDLADNSIDATFLVWAVADIDGIDRALSLARATDDPRHRAEMLVVLAPVAARSGRPIDARQLRREAAEAAELVLDPGRQAALWRRLAQDDELRATGRPAAALARLAGWPDMVRVGPSGVAHAVADELESLGILPAGT